MSNGTPFTLAPRGFRSQLTIWFGGLSLVTLLSAGIYVGRIATQEIATTGGEALYATAKSAADMLHIQLGERELEILLLSQAPHFTQGDLGSTEVRRSLERRKEARSEYAWLGVVDAEGKVLQATGNMLLGQNVAQRPWFQNAKGGVFVGDVHDAVLLAKLMPGSTDGDLLRFIDFAAPIYDAQDRLRGVVGAHAHWDWVTDTVQDSVDRQRLQRHVELLIVNQDGIVLYPQHLAGDFRLPAMDPGQHHQVVRWQDGEDYLTSVATVLPIRSTDLGWRIVLRQPLDAAVQPIRDLRNRLLMLGVLAALVFAWVAYRMAARISRPIELLAEAAERLDQRQGTPEFPAGLAVLEVDRLSSTLRRMTQSMLNHERELETMNASLERKVAERTEALTEANRELERRATVDGLTGVYNRRRFEEKLHELLLTMKRTGRCFTLLVIDADHFKRINDTHGHQVGDDVLRQLAQVLQGCTRSTDFVARYGGEEFVVLLPEAHEQTEGQLVAEKIRKAVEDTPFAEVGRVTVSVGHSVSHPSDTAGKAVVARADEALYNAKGSGRNRVESIVLTPAQ